MNAAKILLLCVLNLVSSAISFKKMVGEYRGDGLTGQEADIIKARIIEISEQTKGMEIIRDKMQEVVSAALGNLMGSCYLGLGLTL